MRESFFLDGDHGRLFCLRERPKDRPARVAALVLAPFGEEMNKSRHVLSALLRALAAAGHDAILPDLHGTGDSAGDFGEATIAGWRDDIVSVLASLPPELPVHVLGLRAGALLAADLATREPRVRVLTLLHPVLEGSQQLTQLLRLRLAGNLAAAGSQESMADLKQRLASGESLEIGGYTISAELAAGLGDLSLRELQPPARCEVHWIELAPAADRPLMPASSRLLDAWAGAGTPPAATSVIACDQFWSTQEIAHCPALVEAVADIAAGVGR